MRRWMALVGALGMCVTSSVWCARSVIAAADAVEVEGPVTLTYGDGDLQPLEPSRLLDTREGNGAPSGKVGPQSTTVVQVAGRGGVPATGVGAVVLNITATEPTAASFVTAFPTGEPMPVASNLNIRPGETVPNFVVVKLGVGGTVSLFNLQGETHLLADVSGWFPEGSGLQPMSPMRLLDTRTGVGAPSPGAVAAGTSIDLQIAGMASLPASGIGAVVLNVTVTEPTEAGFVTVYPSGQTPPLASNLNFSPGLTVPNLVIAKVGSNGAVSLFNSNGSTHLIADVAGWFPDSSGLTAITPLRVLDTREGVGAPAGSVGPGGEVHLQIAGAGGLPSSGIGAVVLNMTVTQPSAYGFVTVYPSGTSRPTASSLNMRPGQTVPNLVIAKLGADGAVNVYNSHGNSHLIADVVGWFRAAGDNQTTLGLKPGTVLAGAGDLVSAVAQGDQTTVVLAGSADLPSVGGHLAVASSATFDGAFGLVTAVVANSDGTTTVTLASAVLEAAFSDIESTYLGPIDLSSASQPAPTAAAPDCGVTGSVGIEPTVSFGGFTADFKVSLRDRYVRSILHGEITVGADISLSGALSCTVTLPAKITAPLGPVLGELDWAVTFSVSASVTTSVSAVASATLGFIANGSDVNNVSQVSFTPGSRSLNAELAVTVGITPSVTLDFKLFGLAGVSVSAEFPITGTYIVPDCIKLAIGASVGMAFVLGRWGVEWQATVAAKNFGPLELYRSDGCNDNAWVGTITVAQSMETGTYVEPNIFTYQYSRDYSYTVTSTTASLLAADPYYDTNGDGVVINGVSGTESSSYDYVGVDPEPACNTSTGTLQASPWFYLGGMYEHAGGPLITDPGAGDTVYLLINVDLTADVRCSDGTPLHGGPQTAGLYSAGKMYGVQQCYPGYVEHNGSCLMPVTVSDDGNHLQAQFTSPAPFIFYTNGAGTPQYVNASQTVTIDLARLPNG